MQSGEVGPHFLGVRMEKEHHYIAYVNIHSEISKVDKLFIEYDKLAETVLKFNEREDVTKDMNRMRVFICESDDFKKWARFAYKHQQNKSITDYCDILNSLREEITSNLYDVQTNYNELREEINQGEMK